MNKAKLKAYAPQARKDFIAAVTARANQLGLSDTKGELTISPATRQGDVTLIEGREWPAKVFAQRETLIKRLRKDGFQQVVEAIAYTWFNRFAALRYMEIHDYLGHGYRVLSSTADSTGAHTPDILLHAVDLTASQALLGLNADTVSQLKLAGNQDAELYRRLLIAQCNGLSQAMPFLFERIDDDSELLLPDNLLRTDSVIANLVNEIPEEDWENVEIVGWLYQFYISEKKDQVIGKVVKSEDIPAATQLFTPNWIVQYLVQNSVGRLWMMANPQSTLKSQWPYYIEPAEQTAEVNAQLTTLIQTRMDEDDGSLNPESITVLDPACGSGHILVEAYELLKGIYLERGYRLRDIPRLILKKNLYGLDIDDRAAQLAGFALLMKARADDRRLLDTPVKLNVLSLQESAGMDLDEFAGHLKPYGIHRTVLGSLLDTFTHARTFGSLIQIPRGLEGGLAGLEDGITKAIENGDVFAKTAAQDLVPLVQQAKILAMKFDAVVANPPYMGSGFYCERLKEFIVLSFGNGKADLYAAFSLRNIAFSNTGGFVAMITIPNWMFLSSFEEMRRVIFDISPISSLVHNGRGVWGSDFGSCSFVLHKSSPTELVGKFLRLFEKQGSVVGNDELEQRFHINPRFSVSNKDFLKVPGQSVAYWISFLRLFELEKLGSKLFSGGRLKTHDGQKYLRYSWEVSRNTNRWRGVIKGGDYRKHGGNEEFVVDWSSPALEFYESKGGLYPSKFFGKEGICWSKITSATPSFRIKRKISEYDSASPTIFSDQFLCDAFYLALLNSPVAISLLKGINPTLNTQVADVLALPVCSVDDGTREEIAGNEELLIALSIKDWDSYERSWDFKYLPLLRTVDSADTIEECYNSLINKIRATIEDVKRLEEINNRHIINAFGLVDELSPDVPIEQITLTVNPSYRYGSTLTKEEQWSRFRLDTIAELISYAIGCMMGRYSLDEPGLIYAHSGNVGFDPGRYLKFSADADGIVPITGNLWFEDDAANRVREFVQVVWGAETLEENMTWLAESLGKKESETADETIRRYLADKFYKDHLQTYKKRPIYWLFSSGKQGAFQALVYLHRYNEGTLARMRAEYVVPLTGKIQARIDMLVKDAESAGSTAARNKINKEIEKLRKQHVELLAYDEKLRHYADMRIKLDLDDGVKANYGKFGDLLAEVKAVTGGAGDE